MRYSSTVVLSTLAIGSAAAAHNRHASFHARREASKRDDVDWNSVKYDLSEVDWSAINWKSVFASPTPAAQPAPAAATPTSSAHKEPAPSSAAPAAAAPSKESSSSSGSSNIVSGLITALVTDVSSSIGALTGTNAKAANGGLWIGGDSEFGMDITNTGEDAVIYCWVKQGFSGMSINANAPAISVGLKKGETVQISSAAGVSGACAPATTSTPKSNFGGVSNTWAEFTYPDPSKKSMGAFNVSKNVNMNGCSISMKGSSCTSNMSTCVFQCTSNVDSCETGYELLNCSASNGGGGGYDVVMQGTGGGCNMNDNAERLTVSFS